MLGAMTASVWTAMQTEYCNGPLYEPPGRCGQPKGHDGPCEIIMPNKEHLRHYAMTTDTKQERERATKIVEAMLGWATLSAFHDDLRTVLAALREAEDRIADLEEALRRADSEAIEREARYNAG